MCRHIFPSSYTGKYCIYCGDELAQIYVNEGQLVLRDLRTNKRKYLSVIYNNRQMRAEEIFFGLPHPRITFSDREKKEAIFNIDDLVAAFQHLDGNDVLKLKGD